MGSLAKPKRQVKFLFGDANRRQLVRAVFFGLLGWLCFCNGQIFGQWGNAPALQENFDSDQPSWEMLSIGSGGMFLERARVSDVAVNGKSETYLCEFVNSGIYFLGHPIRLPYLIEDLSVSL